MPKNKPIRKCLDDEGTRPPSPRDAQWLLDAYGDDVRRLGLRAPWDGKLEAFRLRYVEQLTLREIAERLRLSTTRVDHMARECFRRLLRCQLVTQHGAHPVDLHNVVEYLVRAGAPRRNDTPRDVSAAIQKAQRVERIQRQLEAAQRSLVMAEREAEKMIQQKLQTIEDLRKKLEESGGAT